MSVKKGSPIRRLDHFSRQVDSTSQLVKLTLQNQKLNSLIYSKNLQMKSLLEQNQLLQTNHQVEINKFKRIIIDLEKKTQQYQKLRVLQFQNIKQRHQKNIDQSQALKSYHSHQVQFLLKQISQLRFIADSKDQKVQLKDQQMRTLKQSFQREATQLINEINTLKTGLMKLQQDKNRQIRDLSAKRQLERSRTSGAVTSRKQTNQFMQKQIRKLNEQLLQKKQLLNQKNQEIKQKQQYFHKIQKTLKQQILFFKEKQFQLLTQIDSMKNQFQSVKSQLTMAKSKITQRQDQIKSYKNQIQQQREQHAREINSLMAKRRSSKMGSSRSLTSSLKDSNIHAPSSSSQIQSPPFPKISTVLPSVRQQSPDRNASNGMKQSYLTQNQPEQQDELARATSHYDSIIEQLKRSHAAQQELLQHKLKKVQQNLEQKQQEMLDVLTRFSPLVKIHAQQKSLEEDRKQRLQRHWKGDLALLEIILKKYKIQVFR